MPVSAIKAQLKICSILTKRLQSEFPSGLVVPFGAAISGHGTLTSDCDICLITRPSEQERALFTSPNYQPRDLKPSRSLTSSQFTPPPPPPSAPPIQAVNALFNATDSTSPPLTSPPPATTPPLTSSSHHHHHNNNNVLPSPIGDDKFPSSSSIRIGSDGASVVATSQPQMSKEKSIAPFSNRFTTVVSALRGMAECSRVRPIRRARCPIVSFSYKYGPSNFIRCDLSIDNL